MLPRPDLRAALVAALAAPAVAQAQLTITGRVTDEGGRPIAGAQVGVPGTALGALADENGRYRLVVRDAAAPTPLLVRFVGFRPARATVAQTSGTATQDFRLARDVLQLSQIVTTGTRTETERAQLGATLATVQGEQLANAATPQIDVALSGKVAGALIQQNSGTPGGGTSVRIRGLSTISRSAEPLYIVDGVIVDNSSRQLVDLGGYTTNRLADLDPNDIARIEIVKGAAAAALYGSRANDGVVQIFTKRGQAGALRATLRQSVGTDAVERRVAVNRAPVNLAGQQVTRYDYQDDIFRDARSLATNLSFAGGDERTQFFLAGARQDQEGVVRANDYRRHNVRLNLDRQLTGWLKLATSTNYVTSRADLTPNGGIVAQYGVLTNFLFMGNDRNLYRDPVTGQFPPGQSAANPLDVIANWKAPQTVDRYVGGAQLVATPLANVSVDYRFGYDAYTEAASLFIPRGATAVSFPTGLASTASNRARLMNSDLDVSWKASPTRWLQVTPSVGMNWQQQRFDVVTSRAEDLALFVQTAQGSRQFVTEGRDDRRTLGFYGQTQLGVADLLFVTAAVRSDASSAFGREERTQFFPKLGATFDVSGLDGWAATMGRAVSRLRVRSAFGYSGGQPAESFARFSNYVFEPTGSLAGIANSTTRGNERLKPERQRELELGADVEFLGGRVGVEATYYDKRVADLILPRAVRPSTGFLEQLDNVGVLENRGLELLVRSVNVEGTRFGWTTSATLTTSDPRVTRLSTGGAFFIPGSFGIVRVDTTSADGGSAPGHFFGTTYVRDAQGRILDGRGQPIADGSGRIVGIPAIGPRRVIGNPNPRAFFSVVNDVSVGRRLSLRAQFDGVRGNDVFNFDRRLLETPAFGSGAEYARELTGEVPRGYFAARRGVFEEYVEDGSFVKLRELSVSYTLGAGVLRRAGARGATLTLAGRNLVTWTDYTGWDPETNAGAQSTLVRGFAFATTPIPRNVTASVALTF